MDEVRRAVAVRKLLEPRCTMQDPLAARGAALSRFVR